MDFGTNGLAPLSKLPQVADTMLLDQAEKISKFVRIMERELNRRKKLLVDYGVGTLELYREASGQQEPAIVILLVYRTRFQVKRDREAGVVQYQKVFSYLNDFSKLGSEYQSRVGLSVPWFLFLRE